MITFTMQQSARGLVSVQITFPDGSTGAGDFTKFGHLWHPRMMDFSDRQAAYLHAAQKIHLTEPEMRRLRAHGKLTFPTPADARFRAYWREIHTDRKGMYQRFDTPRLKNI